MCTVDYDTETKASKIQHTPWQFCSHTGAQKNVRIKAHNYICKKYIFFLYTLWLHVLLGQILHSNTFRYIGIGMTKHSQGHFCGNRVKKAHINTKKKQTNVKIQQQ
jgi:hypothetical protein